MTQTSRSAGLLPADMARRLDIDMTIASRRPNGTFLPGHSPGRPPGVRPKTWLQKRFIEDLANEWERSGPDALKIAAKEEPIRFLELAAKLLPKEILVGNAIN